MDSSIPSAIRKKGESDSAFPSHRLLFSAWVVLLRWTASPVLERNSCSQFRRKYWMKRRLYPSETHRIFQQIHNDTPQLLLIADQIARQIGIAVYNQFPLVVWITIRIREVTSEKLMENIHELEIVEKSKDDFRTGINGIYKKINPTHE